MKTKNEKIRELEWKNDQLREENRKLLEGSRQIRELTDAVVTQAVVSYGDVVSGVDDAFEMTLPRIDVPALLKRYRIEVKKIGEQRVLRVLRKEADDA